MSEPIKIEEPQGQEVKEMSFLEHLEVLRWVLIRSTVAILVGAVTAFSFKKILFDIILLGPSKTDFISYRYLCLLGEKFDSPGLCIKELPFTIVSNSMQGQFSTHIWISFIAGLILAFPYILWEIWKFISPALYKKEKRMATLFILISSTLFFIGILFGYFVISPMSVQFLVSYKVSDSIQNLIPLNSYFSVLKSSVLASGIMFELPIVIYFLSKIGIVSPQFLRTYRKHAIVVVLIVAAIITPPDILSQVIVTIPVLILYEISILISSVIYKKREQIESKAIKK
jgi:sec-independent protein translocase protein TatC